MAHDLAVKLTHERIDQPDLFVEVDLANRDISPAVEAVIEQRRTR